MVSRIPALLLAALVCAGCTPPCSDGSMLESEGGLVVVRDEHPDAWERSDCTTCHALDGLHRQGCAAVDLAAVREQVAADGVDGCPACHGPMGVQE